MEIEGLKCEVAGMRQTSKVGGPDFEFCFQPRGEMTYPLWALVSLSYMERYYFQGSWMA